MYNTLVFFYKIDTLYSLYALVYRTKYESNKYT